MANTPLDRRRLHEALELARSSFGLTEPNPRVGCILGAEDGRIFGQGATQQAGGPHAEVMALREAACAGHELAGATAWVTLEPCAHHGRTPPCCDALVQARLARVVVALADPYPEVAGEGIRRLRAAGIAVEMADEDLAAAAREVNIGFLSRILRRRPWVRAKIAASLDGRTALDNGVSQWITGPQARTDGHAWRRRASAVLTGVGTVLADDPRMDVRLVPTPTQPVRIVLDSQWRTPPSARILQPPGQVLLVGAAAMNDDARRLREAGAELMQLPGADGRVDLTTLLGALAQRQVNELHLEAGARLSGAFVQAGLVDEWLIYLAPRLLGAGAGMVALDGLTRISDGPELHFTEARLLGPDLRLRGLSGLAAAWSMLDRSMSAAFTE
jgi:diaminohydroxyphosphoribosylaminopyrimidine deaminase/5-amino-6-(5-phosphoribosylamino)uracil reductase